VQILRNDVKICLSRIISNLLHKCIQFCIELRIIAYFLSLFGYFIGVENAGKQSQMRDLLYSPSCAEGNFQFSHISIAGCPLRLEKLENEPFSEFG